MKLRWQLFLLAASAIAPVLVLALAAVFLLVNHERDTMQREALGRARSAMSAIDAKLRGHFTTLDALAASKHLESGDIRGFYEEAKRVLASQPDWLNIGLASSTRKQLMDAVMAFGGEKPLTGDLASYELAVRGDRNVVGNVDSGAVIPEPTVRIRVPVAYGGPVRYVLTVPLKPENFAQVLRAQRLPEDWVIALVDRNRNFIARIPPMPVGQPASESFRAQMGRAPEGWFRGRTVEGFRTYTPYVTSDLSGWVLGIAIPASTVEAAGRRSVGIMAVALIAALAVAFWIAWLVSKRIARPVVALAAATDALGRGGEVEFREPGRIEEIVKLHDALQRAHGAIREREERFRVMADAAPVMVWMSGTDKLCTWFNKAWLDFVGRPMERELGNGWAENVHPDDFERCLDIYSGAFDARQPFSMEYRLRRRDGEYRWLRDDGIPRFEAKGTFAGYIGACMDISGSKQAEQALAQRAHLLDLTHDAILVRDRESRILFWNSGAEEMYCWKADEVLGKVTHMLLQTQFPEPLEAITEKMLRTGRWSGELVHERRDGTRIVVASRWALERDAKGEPDFVLELNSDITDRKHAEEALRASEERLAAETKALSRLHRSSSRLWRAPSLGRGLEEMLAATIDLLQADMGNIQLLEGGVLKIVAQRGFKQDFLEFFREVSTEDDSPCGRALRTGERIVIEDIETDAPYAPLRTIARAAGYRAVQSTPLISRDGKPQGMISTHWRSPHGPSKQELRRLDLYLRQAADFIDRRAAEEQLRSVVDHVVDGIITIDERGAVHTFNPAAERIFGYAASEVIGQNVKMLMPDPYRGDHDSYVANYVRTGQAKIIGIGREVEGRRKDGSTFPLDLAVSVFHIGSRRYFTGVVRDVTERKQAERALKDADRAKDEFLAMLSHELRNPLAALTSSAHVLKVVAPSSADAIKARDVVERQTQHMTSLISDLLDINRVALGKLTLQRERFDAAEALFAVINVWRATGRVGAHIVSPSLEPVWVEGDRVRIEQIASNLLDNAIKFTPAGKNITVNLRREDGEAVLRVADEGIGLAPEDCSRIFDLFVQGNFSPRAGGGLGIGLALVKRLAELHGGSASAASEGRGRGVTFTVRLPAIDQPAVQAKTPSLDVANGRSILIVEDNDDARQMLQAILSLDGHQVCAARDGKTGLALAAETCPDVALIDIALPDMDGYEVARRLRTSNGDRRIDLIAISGFGQAQDQQRAYEAGFDAYLVKPVVPERLKQAIAGLR